MESGRERETTGAEAAEGPDVRGRRRGRFGRRRACLLCVERSKTVDYKDVAFLRRFISDRGRIDSRRRLATCAKHQRIVARAIKRARHLALLPYTVAHMRHWGTSASR